MDRRSFIRLGASSAGAFALGGMSACAPAPDPPTEVFAQGVASGLHSDREVVLWTRVEPLVAPGVGEATWLVARDRALTQIIASGTAAVDADADHTVKLLVDGLPSDTTFWYRFTAAGVDSPIGRARTLPAATDEPTLLRLAFASCQSYSNGFYAAWRDVASRDLDAVVFLGDFIYESGAISLLSSVRPEPFAEATTLEDYRAKYRLYRRDPDLQAAQAAHPWVVVWDDHEFYNDWDRLSIVNDPVRFAAATTAWFDHQPIWRDRTTGHALRIHRSLRWGRLAELIMLDTRQYRDTKGPSFLGAGFRDGEYNRPDRTIMGVEQKAWFLDRLSTTQADGVPWKLIGNQVLFGPQRVWDLDSPELRRIFTGLTDHAGLYTGMDTWDGFPVEREAVLEHLRQGAITGTTFLTGDIHSFWVGGVRVDIDDDTSPVVAHDFASGSISSSPGGLGSAFAAGGTPLSPAWDLIDASRNGYGIIECTPTTATVRFIGHDARFRNVTPSEFASFDLTT